MNILKLTIVAGLVGAFGIATTASALPFVDSLWIGNDTSGTAVNVDKTGALLRPGPAGTAVGYAVDPANNKLYVNNGFSSFTPYDLTTLAPGASVAISSGTYEDFTFNGSKIVAGAFGGGVVNEIDPSTGVASLLFTLPFTNPLGIAYDGIGYWVSDFNGSGIYRFTSSGTQTAAFASPGSSGGGLAYDPTDNTLFVGGFGQMFHITTGGTLLGTSAVPNGGSFVDGLEYEGGVARQTVPEPTSLALLGIGVAGLAAARRRKQMV